MGMAHWFLVQMQGEATTFIHGGKTMEEADARNSAREAGAKLAEAHPGKLVTVAKIEARFIANALTELPL